MANSPARSVVDVGSVIADTYTIEAVIGRGGMGAVFLASHRRLPGKKVAIKLLHAELTDDEVVARFRREALIASQLNHPNIVGVTDFNVTADGTPYLVLEYLQGETLAQRIAQGPMPLEQTVSIMRQVGSAMAAAHREGIVHRDLKPQNIFIVPTVVDGRVIEIAKVLDFGISKIRGSQTVMTQESTLLGTPQYMAPEQATGQHTTVDGRTDVFALGAIVYEMVSGVPAFSGANIPEVVFKVVYEHPVALATRIPSVPPAVEAAVVKAMAKPADERFPTVAAFIEALTGQPLLEMRAAAIAPPVVGFAAGSKHRTGSADDAFAQTMGSADHGSSPLAPVSAHGATLASQVGAAATMAGPTASARVPVPAPAPAVATVPASPAAAEKRRSPVVVIGIALACVAVAVVVMYAVMHQPPKPDGPVAGGSNSGSNPVVAPPPVPAVDAAIAVDATAIAAATDAAIVVIDAPGKRPRPDAGAVAAPVEGPEDEGVAKQLAEAEGALGGDPGRAERFANTVINSADAKGRQRARAHVVHGIVKCTQQNDQEAAQIDLRNLKGYPALQQKLIAACKRAGVELR